MVMAGLPLGSKVAALHELQSAWVEPSLRAEGLSWSTFQLLVTISSSGSVSQVEIARDLGVTPATLSESVHTLVVRGLIEQVPGDKDRRVKVLRLTPAATQKLSRVRKVAGECEVAMLDGVSQRDLESCSKVLDLLIARLEQSLSSK